jgi:cell division protein FtsW (lipid II flippase)
VLAEAILVPWFLLAVLSILLYAPFWILGGLCKKRRRPAERAMRLWPLIAVLSLLASVGLLMLASNDPFARLGNMTVCSFSLFLTTAAYGVASLASAVALCRAPKHEVRRSVGWYCIAATAALLIAAAYLTYWGVIGIRIWS